MTKIPFINKSYRAKKCLELGHNKVCVPFNVHAQGEYNYFIMFMDY